MNKLEICVVEENERYTSFDFYIDGQALSTMVGVDKSEDMDFSDCDLDFVVVDREQFPDYNRAAINSRFAEQLLGVIPPLNQFGTERIVLYRYHCGCDYCGTISFYLRIEEELIYWEDIRFENETEFDNLDLNKISSLKFDKKHYRKEIERYLEKIRH